MEINRILIIFTAILALSIAAPVSAQNSREARHPSPPVGGLEYTDSLWGYMSMGTGDIAVIVSVPNEDDINPDFALMMMPAILEEETTQSREIRVDEDYEDDCIAFQAKMDGDRVFQVVCATEDVIIIALGTDKGDTLEAAYSTLEDGEPTLPRSYTLIEES